MSTDDKPALTLDTAIGTFRSTPQSAIDRRDRERGADPYSCECRRCTLPGTETPTTWTKRPKCPRCLDNPGRCKSCGSPRRCPGCNDPHWDAERKRPRRTEEEREAAKEAAHDRWGSEPIVSGMTKRQLRRCRKVK